MISGDPEAGGTLSVSDAEWDDELVTTGVEWLRDGEVVGEGTTYDVTSADEGATLTARTTGQRPDYVQEFGLGDVVTFAPATFDVTVDVPAVVTKVKPKLRVKAKKAKAGKKAVLQVVVKAAGIKRPVGKLTVTKGKKKLGATKLRSAQKGKATIKLKKKLPRGKHKIVVTLGGTKLLTKATKRYTLRIR